MALPGLVAMALAGLLAGCGQATSSGATLDSSNTGGHGNSGNNADGGIGSQEVVSGGGSAGRSAQQVYASAVATSRSVPGVHLAATLHQGQTVEVNLTVVAGHGAAGTIRLDGGSVKVIKVGNTVYAQPSAAFLRSQGTLAKLFTSRVGHKWVKTDAGSADLAGLGALSPYSSATDALTAIVPKDAPLKLVSGSAGNGQPELGLKFSLPGQTGTLWVAADGIPYPLRLESAQVGTVTFSDWGTTAPITVPPAKDVVDLNNLSLSGLG